MTRSLTGIIVGISLIIVGIILMAVPSTGWNGEALQNGFQALDNSYLTKIFKSQEVGLTIKAGVVLAVYLGPIITVVSLTDLLIQIFRPEKPNKKTTNKKHHI